MKEMDFSFHLGNFRFEVRPRPEFGFDCASTDGKGCNQWSDFLRRSAHLRRLRRIRKKINHFAPNFNCRYFSKL
jgi:hypothetical protein